MVQEEARDKMKIRLSKPYIGDKAEVMAMLSEMLDSGFLTQGKHVWQLEKAVAGYLGAGHAVAVSSGTAALHIALVSLGIRPHDEVIVPAYTFPATANVVELIGAKPVFVDVETDTYNMDTKKLESAITSKTRAIMPVHLFGNPADMEAIMAIAAKKKIPVVEDAAGAIGSEYKRKKCGTIGRIGCFSFHPRKVVATAEGGMLVTDDANLAAKARMLRNHGIESTPAGIDFAAAGFNYRMNELEAALGCVQMKEIK
jgi:perosamine synthetase